jgi:hypothetical protein
MDGNEKDIRGGSDEISIKDIVGKIKAVTGYLKSKWLLILLFALLCGIGGFGYALIKKPLYSAQCTFVLDDGGSHSSLGQYSSLAALAGVDITGASGGGIFQGDNILELYKSRTMIEKALLSSAVFNGKSSLLIDRYIAFNKLRKTWKEKDHIDSINFNGDPEKFNRRQDSLITAIVDLFNKKNLLVAKPDKKLSIIDVDFSSGDELFAKNFTDKLVETVNNFYVETKTKKSQQNVQILQRQADSVRAILNSSISGVAAAADEAPNANPFMQTLKVPSQRKQVDVQASSAIYSGIVQNLEIAKVTLRQETPLIQVIDSPVLPLHVDKTSPVLLAIIAFIVGAVLCTIYLTIKKIITNIAG